jgi:ribosome-associated translation inhibitor RaiA
MTIGRDLQDCIDDEEGYYIHFFSPAEKEATKNKSKESLSNETVTGALSDMSDKLNDFVKVRQDEAQTQAEKVNSDIYNPVEKSMDELKNQFNEFKEKASQANILQASVELMAPSSGTLMGKDVFYVWFKENMLPSSYRTTGKSVTTDGNNTVEKNYADGTLKINGKTILDSDKADHTRMIAHDNRVPAEIVPVTLNKVSAPMNNQVVFEMNSYGEIKVLNSEVLDCIQKAVKDQTGIEYSGDELTQVFGSLKQLGTKNYGSIFARDGKIYLEGTAPRAQGDYYSKLIIDGYWNTKLTIDANNGVDAGEFTGMTFLHGSIVLKPETNELVIWIRQHKDSVLTNKDVKDLLAHPTTVIDPESECPVPAIDLEAVSFPNDELSAKKVENYNTSVDHLGPFTQFTTDKKIYEFYSKRDGNTGECKDFFRVRDKDTGKILEDKEIVGGIKQDSDGTIRFKTADGKEHTLDFSAENGVPKVSYNGGSPETLLSAQGPNGSFWYDPESGLWYPENGLQIPLNQNFKDNGAYFGSDENGNVTGTGMNPMTFNIGQGEGSGFNLPSMPETTSGIILFITLFLLLSYTLTYKRNLKVKHKR